MTRKTFGRIKSISQGGSVIYAWVSWVTIPVLIILGMYFYAFITFVFSLFPYLIINNTIVRGYLYDYWKIEQLPLEDSQPPR
jgi:hypothetical protein